MRPLRYQAKNQKVVYVVIAALAIAALTYVYNCGFQKVCKFSVVEKVVRKGNTLDLPKGTIYAEIVDTPQSRAQGLSGRSALAEDEGMLFVFDQSGKYGFWMKDMKFAIDMVWITEDGTVVHVERNINPSSYFDYDPPQTFINDIDAKYVLELADGQASKYGLYLGTRVKIPQ